MPEQARYLQPNWPCSPSIRAFVSTRHVAREQIVTDLKLPAEPLWLTQQHTALVVNAEDYQTGIVADAIVSRQLGTVCAVLTADCLPILLTSQQTNEVAAIHAGWRGLAAGIIANTLQQMQSAPDNIMVWLGPAIGPDAFTVGAEVVDRFLNTDITLKPAFRPHPHEHEKYSADIYAIARIQLRQLGVEAVYGGDYCTYSQGEKFFSYRRMPGETGRMVSLIYLN